jgi:hypothetical protein
MKLSIVMPTVPGRQDELARTIDAYERLTPNAEIEWIIERGHDTCGTAWNAGARKATGEVLHMGADDGEPETDRWLPAAELALALSRVPLGWVREGDQTFGRDFCRVVICRREWWQDVPDLHYFSDNCWTDLMIAAGHTPMVAEGFDFYHRKSMVGRDESPERLERERAAYLAAMEAECGLSPSSSSVETASETSASSSNGSSAPATSG